MDAVPTQWYTAFFVSLFLPQRLLILPANDLRPLSPASARPLSLKEPPAGFAASTANARPPRPSRPHCTPGTLFSRPPPPPASPPFRPPAPLHYPYRSFLPVTNPNALIGIDLFAGAGGMSLGATNAGIAVTLAVESDSHAVQTYAANHPHTRLFAHDIRTLRSHTLRRWKAFSDRLIVFGGPPCQGFSWSNVRTRNTSNATNWLFREFLRVVRFLNPAWVVFENVQGLVNTARGQFLQEIRTALQNGYALHQELLNAVDYGVPQSRTRFFLVCSRHNRHQFRFPTLPHRPLITVDEAIRDLPPLLNGNTTSLLRYGPCPTFRICAHDAWPTPRLLEQPGHS